MASAELAHVLAPRPDINVIPDELLLKILAFVPYPGPTLSDASIAIKQHDALKLVSSRFNSILSSKAFQIELLRCQYQDIVQLWDIKSISGDNNPRDIDEYSTRIDAVVEELMNRDRHDNMRSMLRASIMVLDYLNCENTLPSIRDRMMLVEWVNNSVFSPLFRIILRFTLARAQDFIAAEHFGTILVAPRSQLSSLWNIDNLPQSNWAATLRMHKYRSFETAVLLNWERCSLLTALTDRLDEVLDQAEKQHEFLLPVRVKHDGDEHFKTEWDHDEAGLDAAFARYVDGYHWRILSPRTSKPVSQNKSTSKSGKDSRSPEEIALDKEVQSGWNSFKIIRQLIRQSDAITDFLDVDFKAVGEFVKHAKRKIERGDEDIPGDIVKFAEEGVSLRGYIYATIAGVI